LKVLREAALDRIVVCIDDSLDCGSESIVSGEVLRYRKRVDAGALLRAAERISSCAG
jgi:hypothetical protein